MQTSYTLISEVPTHAEIRSLIFDRMYNRLTSEQQANCHLPSDVNACYYHYDDTNRKVRIIALDDYELPRVDDGSGNLLYIGSHLYETNSHYAYTQSDCNYYTQSQLQWFIDTLKATPAGYTIITNNHIGLRDFGTVRDLGNSVQAMVQILCAFKNKTAGSVTVNDINGATGYTINYDFTTVNSYPIMHHHGHIHTFEKYTPVGANIPTIQTQCPLS